MAKAQGKEMEDGPIDLKNGERIGGGAFGDVYKFADGNGFFALKVPKYEEDAVKRKNQSEDFIKEGKKLIQCEHPNIVKYFDVVDVNDNYGKKQPGIKMEFCERGSLKELIFNQTQIIYSMTDISIWAEQLFAALVYICDEHRIIHQDIKAENIFVTKDFSLKLGDFGLWKENEGTRSGVFDCGTDRYRSPPEIPDPKSPNETFPKLSHRNDVYSMGLVLWELIERRVVLSEFNDRHGGFDYLNFYLTVLLPHHYHLPHVRGPDCLGKMKEIVQACTRFQRRERPEASGILEEIKTLNQANRGANQVTPRKDLDEKRLIRPIGFNGKTNREPVKDQMADGLEMIQEYHVNPWYSEWNEPVALFVERLNSLNPDKRLEFHHKIPDLIVKALEDKKFFFHEVKSDLEKLRQKMGWTNHPLEDLFQLIIELNQKETELDIGYYIGKLSPLLTKVAFPCINISDYHDLTEELEKLGPKLRSRRFYFRAFLSTEPVQVWLVLRDVELFPIFIRNDFQLALRKGKWMNTEKSKYRVGDDDLYYLEDQEIDFYEMLNKIKVQEQLLIFQARLFLDQSVSLEKSLKRTESISVPPIGSGLLVKNYIFQLRNPPRIDCTHHTKCSILKYSGPGGELKEMGIPYYSCSSRESHYLKEWFNFCIYFLKDNLPLIPSADRKITAYSFIFIQFKCDNQYYTLLDHPNNYEDHELIYYLDKRRELHKMESTKIRKSLEEMAPKMRRYAVYTLVRHLERFDIFYIDQEGNRLPWSLSE